MGGTTEEKRPRGAIDYIAIRDVAKRCKVTPETVRVWITRGVRIRNRKEPVRLKAHWIGGRWVTTNEWVDDYIAASTQSRIGCMPSSWREDFAAEREAVAAKLNKRKGA